MGKLIAHLSMRASGHETEGAEIRHNASIRRKEWCYYCKGMRKGRVSTDANSGVVKASTTRVVS